MPDEDSLRHKYAPLPDEPRFKKRRRKRHVRSDHKHEYETVCIDAHEEVVTREGRFPYFHVGTRCKICGRLQDVRTWPTVEVPDGMPLYEVDDFFELWKMKFLPDGRRVR